MADAMGPSGPRATRGGRAVATPSRRRHASFAVSMGVDAVRDGIRRDDAVARGGFPNPTNPSLAGWSRVGENPAARDGRPDRVPARVASHRDAAWSASIAFVAMTTHSASRVMHDTAASSSNARLSGARIPSAGF